PPSFPHSLEQEGNLRRTCGSVEVHARTRTVAISLHSSINALPPLNTVSGIKNVVYQRFSTAIFEG
ncbi:MAG: hypothetical protein FWH41_05285, partial [Treponema sp.]|nr:hypothetical protein [Treponema sp.]